MEDQVNVKELILSLESAVGEMSEISSDMELNILDNHRQVQSLEAQLLDVTVTLEQMEEHGGVSRAMIQPYAEHLSAEYPLGGFTANPSQTNLRPAQVALEARVDQLMKGLLVALGLLLVQLIRWFVQQRRSVKRVEEIKNRAATILKKQELPASVSVEFTRISELVASVNDPFVSALAAYPKHGGDTAGLREQLSVLNKIDRSLARLQFSPPEVVAEREKDIAIDATRMYQAIQAAVLEFRRHYEGVVPNAKPSEPGKIYYGDVVMREYREAVQQFEHEPAKHMSQEDLLKHFYRGSDASLSQRYPVFSEYLSDKGEFSKRVRELEDVTNSLKKQQANIQDIGATTNLTELIKAVYGEVNGSYTWIHTVNTIVGHEAKIYTRLLKEASDQQSA